MPSGLSLSAGAGPLGWRRIDSQSATAASLAIPSGYPPGVADVTNPDRARLSDLYSPHCLTLIRPMPVKGCVFFESASKTKKIKSLELEWYGPTVNTPFSTSVRRPSTCAAARRSPRRPRSPRSASVCGPSMGIRTCVSHRSSRLGPYAVHFVAEDEADRESGRPIEQVHCADAGFDRRNFMTRPLEFLQLPNCVGAAAPGDGLFGSQSGFVMARLGG